MISSAAQPLTGKRPFQICRVRSILVGLTGALARRARSDSGCEIANKPPRRFGWVLGAIGLACLVLGACVVSAPRRQVPQPAPRLGASHEIAGAVPEVSLDFIPGPGSDAELRGTTNISSWKSRSADIGGLVMLGVDEVALNALFKRIQAELPNSGGKGEPPPLSLAVRGPTTAVISVPVMSLRGDSAGMDQDMQKALKAEQHPMIEFTFQHLENAAMERNSPNGPAGLKLRIAGTLSMAGATRPMTMDVIVKRDSRRRFVAQAQTTMRMSDFGITPPVALLGLIRAGDRVQVSFDLNFVLKNDRDALQN